MSWIIERAVENLDLLLGLADITSGVRKIFFSIAILSLSVCSGCTYSIRERTDAIGDSTTSYSLLWAEPTAEQEPPPRQHVSRRRAMREEQQVEASPLGAKWYK
jgi:hypothetical protein